MTALSLDGFAFLLEPFEQPTTPKAVRRMTVVMRGVDLMGRSLPPDWARQRPSLHRQQGLANCLGSNGLWMSRSASETTKGVRLDTMRVLAHLISEPVTTHDLQQ